MCDEWRWWWCINSPAALVWIVLQNSIRCFAATSSKFHSMSMNSSLRDELVDMRELKWKSINHSIKKFKIKFHIAISTQQKTLPSLFAVGVVELKGNPFDDSWFCDDEFCRFCAALKFKLFCRVLVNEGWRAEKSLFMNPTFMSRTCILIFSRTSLCWKFCRFWTPMLRADKLLNMPKAWFVGNGVSLISNQVEVKRERETFN